MLLRDDPRRMPSKVNTKIRILYGREKVFAEVTLDLGLIRNTDTCHALRSASIPAGKAGAGSAGVPAALPFSDIVRSSSPVWFDCEAKDRI